MYNIKKDLNRNVFREYDIRGIYEKDIDVDFAYTFGLSFGSYIRDLGKTSAVVGHDNRLSSPALYDALIEGIIKSGVNVVKLGLVTTPMFYYGCIKLNIPSGVMVTASHNPKEYNGFKFSFDEKGNARGEMISNFYNFMTKYIFKEGQGTISEYDIKNDYLDLFDKSLNIEKNNLKVVIDPGNGTTSIIANEIYSKYINNLISICDKSDGTFPNHHPDPLVEENLDMLKKKVLEEKADIGIAFDGDGDRVGVIDNNGKFISIDKVMILIIRDLINKVENKTFLFDVKCTNALKDEIEKLNGKYIEYRTGNSYTKAGVTDNDLPFGGELSGHLFFNDRFPGFDSALYAGLRVIEIMARTNKTITELLEGINEYLSTPEIRVEVREDNKKEIVEKVKEYSLNKGYKINEIDGVKVLYDDGFALVRASNTGPNLTLRFEAKDKETLKLRKEEFEGIVDSYK